MKKKKWRKKSSYQVSVKLVIKPMFKQLWLANSNTSRRCNEEAELHNGSYVWREDVEGVELIIIRWKNSGWSCINRYKDTEIALSLEGKTHPWNKVPSRQVFPLCMTKSSEYGERANENHVEGYGMKKKKISHTYVSKICYFFSVEEVFSLLLSWSKAHSDPVTILLLEQLSCRAKNWSLPVHLP